MDRVIKTITAGIVFSGMLIYIMSRGGGGKIDPIKLDKIRKDIKEKPLLDVIDSVNDWLS